MSKESEQKKQLKHLHSLFEDGDREGASEILMNWGKKYSFMDAISSLIDPALTNFGKNWGVSEKVSLGQGYVISKVAEESFNLAMEERKRLMPDELRPSKGPVVIGNIKDDHHGLGRKLVITFITMEGWEVIDLGSDVTPEEFVDEAVKADAPIIAVSAMMLRTALNIKGVREEIERRGLKNKIRLAVGGAVFCQRPELVEEVGADGTARNAILAPILFDKFLNEISDKRGGSIE